MREYLNQTVSEEKLSEVITAAMYAPSANDIHPWELVVVQDAASKELLSKVTPWSSHAKSADTVIAVIANAGESNDWVEDCSIVAQHIWLEAQEQGLGSCWIQIRGNANAEQSVKEILGIPEDFRVLCLMPLGVPAKVPPEHQEDEFDKSKVKYERYK